MELRASRQQRDDEILQEESVKIASENVILEGDLAIPDNARGIVIFAHGSGSSRHSPRNRHVARILQNAGLGTLLMDLLTSEEEAIDIHTAHLRFDIDLLAERLGGATEWFVQNYPSKHLQIGYFGASTGAAAALMAAAEEQDLIKAIVSRGGRPDLAHNALAKVVAPTLLIVGGDDEPVIGMNREAMAGMKAAECKLVIVQGATHLFEEPGKLDEVAALAKEWFLHYLRKG
jgi:putative phosphoribosyl transferase